jgi:DHA2 family methylenomycin A resistance protein-like MFS transporter
MTLSSSSRPTNPRLALLVIAVVFAILNADITTVNVALVTLGKDLHADLGDLQWGLNSYMLAFAALIVAAGRVADVFGRRRCLLAGAILFAVASLLCGMASTLSVLIIGRVLQGAAGALMVPAGMAVISNAYGAEQRALALGTLVGVSGVAQSMGPLLGGFLTAEVSWRWVFLMNLPLVAVIMIVAVRSIQESHAENASHRIDIIGVIILAAALTSLLLGLNAAQSPDKDQVVGLGLIALSLVSFVILTLVERRTNAILDGKLLRLPSFLCSCVASFLLGFVFFLFLFITAVYLQERLGYNALTAGIALAPLSLVLAVTGVMSGRLTGRFPLPTLLIMSCVSLASGLAILSFMPASYGYVGMVVPFLLIAAGVGPGFTLLNTAGLAAISAERSGQATGMIYMFRFAGGAIGVSAASALHSAIFRHQLVFRLSETPLAFAQQKLLEQPGAAERIRQIDSGLLASQVEQVRQAFYESFAAAFTGTLRLNVLVPIAMAILTMMLMIRKKEGTKQTPSMDAGATADL